MMMTRVHRHQWSSLAVLLAALACNTESESDNNDAAGSASSADDDSAAEDDNEGARNDDDSVADDDDNSGESGGSSGDGEDDNEGGGTNTEDADGEVAGAAGARDAGGATSGAVCAGEPWDEAEFAALPCTEYTIATTRIPKDELESGVACAFLLPLSPSNRQLLQENIDLVAYTSETTLDNYPELESLDECGDSEYGGYVYVAPESGTRDDSGIALLCPCTCRRLGDVEPFAFACGR